MSMLINLCWDATRHSVVSLEPFFYEPCHLFTCQVMGYLFSLHYHLYSLQQEYKIDTHYFHVAGRKLIFRESFFCCHTTIGCNSRNLKGQYHSKANILITPWEWQPTPTFCLGNPTDRGAWQDADHGVAKRETTERLSPHCHCYILEY